MPADLLYPSITGLAEQANSFEPAEYFFDSLTELLARCVDANYFFFDGMYWVYQNDNWYASSWYNGPWGPADPWVVQEFMLRIPVGYYRHPHVYFRGWRADATPHWGEHWDHGWAHQRSGWNRWDCRSAPEAAPLPHYQQQFTGNRYPGQMEQERALRSQNYRYQPHETIVRQHFQQLGRQRAPEHGHR